MRPLRHPLSGAVYELDVDGNVEVTKDGRRGVFDAEGRWLSGEIRGVDPELCRWVGLGPRVPGDLRQNRRFRAVTAPVSEDPVPKGQL